MKAERQLRKAESEMESLTRGVTFTLELQKIDEKFEKQQFLISMWIIPFLAFVSSTTCIYIVRLWKFEI